MAGAASSTSGFITLFVTGIAGTTTMQFYDNSPTPLIVGVLSCIILLTVSYYLMVWRTRMAADVFTVEEG